MAFLFPLRRPGRMAGLRLLKALLLTSPALLHAAPAASPLSFQAYDSSKVNQPMAMAATGDGRFLYVGNVLNNTVTTYTLPPAGNALLPLGAPLAGQVGTPYAAVMDPQNKFLYVGNFSSGISVFAIAANGALTAVPGSPFAVGSSGQDSIQVSGVAVDPAGQYLYALTQNVSGDPVVYSYSIDRNAGALTQLQQSYAVGNSNSSTGGAIKVSPDGRNALVVLPNDSNLGSNYNGGGLFVYPLSGGSLGAQGATAALGMYSPGSVVTSRDGQYVYVATSPITSSPTSHSNSIAAFAFRNSTLTPLSGSPYSTGGNTTTALAVDPTGYLLYAAGYRYNPADQSQPGSAWVYALNPATGALTAVGGTTSTYGGTPSAIVVSPDSRYAYVSNLGPDVQADGLVAFNTGIPTLGLPQMTSLASGPATLSASYGASASYPLQSAGFYYSSSPLPSAASIKVTGTMQNGAITATIAAANLTPGATYYVTPYVTVSSGATYLGTAAQVVYATTPVLSVTATASLTGVTFKGTLQANGTVITQEGFVYALTPNPTTADTTLAVTGINPGFSTTMPTWLPGRNYYVRAYATDTAGNTTYSVQTTVFAPPGTACQDPLINTITIPGTKVLGTDAGAFRAYVLNSGKTPGLALVNTLTFQVVTTIPTNRATVSLAVNPQLNRVYYSNGSGTALFAINGSTGAQLQQVALTGMSNGGQLIALDADSGDIYVADKLNKVLVKFRSSDLTEVARVTLPSSPAKLLVNSTLNKVYIAYGTVAAQYISVFDDNLKAVTTLRNISNVNDMTLNQVANQIYFSRGDQDEFIDSSTDTVVKVVRTGHEGKQLRYNPTSQKLYTAIDGHGSLWAIQLDPQALQNAAVVGSVNIGAGTVNLAVDAIDNVVYAISQSGNVLSVINSQNDAVMKSITLPTPDSLHLITQTNTAVIGSSTSNAVYVVQCQ